MKRTLLALVALSFAFASCASLAPTHTIDAQAAGALILSVCDQHDELVARDTVLVPAEKEQALRSTELVRAIVAEAQGPR